MNLFTDGSTMLTIGTSMVEVPINLYGDYVKLRKEKADPADSSR